MPHRKCKWETEKKRGREREWRSRLAHHTVTSLYSLCLTDCSALPLPSSSFLCCSCPTGKIGGGRAKLLCPKYKLSSPNGASTWNDFCVNRGNCVSPASRAQNNAPGRDMCGWFPAETIVGVVHFIVVYIFSHEASTLLTVTPCSPTCALGLSVTFALYTDAQLLLDLNSWIPFIETTASSATCAVLSLPSSCCHVFIHPIPILA